MLALCLRALALSLLLTVPAAAAPAGMAISVNGKPEFRSVAGDWKALVLRQKLEPGDAIRCGAGAQATVVLFADGGRFRIGSGKEAAVEVGTVRGAESLGALGGPSARVAQALGGAPAGVVRARPGSSHRRLTAKGPVWWVEGERRLQWDPEPGAQSYLVSLFDQADNVVWSHRTSAVAAELPEAESPFGFRRPYLWRLTVFGRSGKPAGSRWGVITFLSATDVAKLESEEKGLLEAIKSGPDDLTPRLLLAELYQGYGVMERTLEVLDDLRAGKHEGIEAAIEEAHRQISLLAHLLYTQSRTGP